MVILLNIQLLNVDSLELFIHYTKFNLIYTPEH